MKMLVASAFMAVTSNAAQAEDFFFPHVGMHVTSVESWEVVSGLEFIEMNRAASFGTEDLDALLHADTDAPFFSMLSDIRMGTGVRAGFNAFAFDGTLPDLDLAAKNMEDYMMQSFRDANLIKPRTASVLGGQDAMTMALTYTLDITGGGTQTIYEEVWLVPRKTNYVTISYGTVEQDTDAEIWRDIRRTLNSITWED